MKANKILGLALLFSVVSVGFVSAQEQKPVKNPQDRIVKHTDRMKKELNLTDEQALKMKNIEMSVLKDREQMQKNMQDARQNFMLKMKGYEAEMQKVLTPEQFQKYRAKMQRMMGRMEGYRMGMRDARKMGHPGMRHGMNGSKRHVPTDDQPAPANDSQVQK
jgi:Spy/CpxP family protein refolding chaperone